MSTKIKMRKHNLCHKCPHNGKGDQACLTCRDPAISAHRGSVSLDALSEIGKEPCVEPTNSFYDDDDIGDNTMHRNIDELMLIVSTFLSLTPEQFAVVKTLYQDKKNDGYTTYRHAAEKLGIDRHDVADTLAEALRACPALAALHLHKSVKPQWPDASRGLPVVDVSDDDVNDIRLPPGEPTDADTPTEY